MRRALALAALLFAACEGTVGELDAGETDAGSPDAGKPIVLNGFTQRADGWPAGERLLGTALLDNVLYAASESGVQALPLSEARWSAVTTPATGDEKPTSFQRVERSLVLTVAGASSGGVLVKEYDAAWSRLTAPTTPAWSLTKKGSELLLATTGGLFAAPAIGNTWTRRSAISTPLFTHAVRRLIAAPGQARMFASGDAAFALGALSWSDDSGATWSSGLVRGDVLALAASGSYVFVESTMDGALRSDNYGNTFKAMPGMIGAPAQVFLVTQTRVWAGTASGLRISDDWGATWSDDTNGLPAGLGVRGLFLSGSLLVADTPMGPFVTQFQ